MEPERRRRRPAVSCTLCRRRKIKCNRESPCSNCVKSGNANCVYERHPSPPVPVSLRQNDPAQRSSPSSASGASTKPGHTSSLPEGASTGTSSVLSQPSAWDVDLLKNRIRQLEEQLSRATPKPKAPEPPAPSAPKPPPTLPTPFVETSVSSIGGTLYMHQQAEGFERAKRTTRGITHKTRRFGLSHWINSVMDMKETVEMIDPYLYGQGCHIFSNIVQGKALSKTIKNQRTPPWPTTPTANLPSKDIADDLVDTYLRTSETVYRILHVPSFKRDYEALWTSDSPPNMSFVVQLKLVMAIGAAAHDDTFSLRTSANYWVYEAHTWLSEPVYKPRLDLQTLQTNLLILIARELLSIGAPEVWISAGALYRRLVYMGLHRDPSELPGISDFSAEMRRRLWNTTLEICLQTSLTSGSPPFITMDDFDTEPPQNLDDEQLTADEPVAKPDEEYTQMAIAIALRKALPIRLVVGKFLNDIKSPGTYEETLRIDAELRSTFKTLSRTLQGFRSGGPAAPREYELHVVDFLMNRYLSALHIPFFGPNMTEAAHAYSRKIVVESMVKIWYLANPTSARFSGLSSGAPEHSDFSRMIQCGGGSYRVGAYQALLLIAQELKMQINEDDSLGPAPLRPDLLAITSDAQAWFLRTMEAGETNVKGLIFLSMIIKLTDALRQGLSKEDTAQCLLKAAEEAQAKTMPILQRIAGQVPTTEVFSPPPQVTTNMNTPSDIDWDYIMSDAFQTAGNADAMNWMLNGDIMQSSTIW